MADAREVLGDKVLVDPRFRRRPRQPGLDLLRAVAIIVVVIYHAGIMGFPLPGRIHRFGWVGVDLFFVLSGYLIGGQLVAPLARQQKIDLPRFFARRALRIMPAYFVILAIYLLLPAWREYPEMSPAWKFVLSVQNIGLHGGTAFSHAWSLAVEDQFYLTLPFILIVLSKYKRAGFLVPIGIVLGGIILRFILAREYLGETGVSFRGFQTWIYYPTWTRLDPLVVGVVLAAIEKYQPRSWKKLSSTAAWIWLPAIALIVYALWLGESQQLSIAACVWQFPLIAIGMAGLLLFSVSSRSVISRAAIPGAAFLASIAYSAYLVQKLIIHFVGEQFSAQNIELTSPFALLAVEVGVYLVATILFFAIERPFLQLRHRVAPRN